MVLVHHQEARMSKELKPITIAYQYDGKLMPMIRINFNLFKGLVEGVDFEINELGEIRRII